MLKTMEGVASMVDQLLAKQINKKLWRSETYRSLYKCFYESGMYERFAESDETLQDDLPRFEQEVKNLIYSTC